MLTLTVLAAVALSAASVYVTCKAVNAIFSTDLLSWLWLSQIASALRELASALISSVGDN